MVDYAFEQRHHDGLLDGSKPFTLRKAGKTRHARTGHAVGLKASTRGPAFATAVCAYRATVVFGPAGILRVHSVCACEGGELVYRLLNSAEQGAPQAAEHLQKVAEFDGFESWADLVRWHAAQEGEGYAGGNLTREVIGFADVRKLEGA